MRLCLNDKIYNKVNFLINNKLKNWKKIKKI